MAEGSPMSSPGRVEDLSAYLELSAPNFPFKLTPIAALREIVAVCESIATGHPPPQQKDRKSLRNDVQMALAAIGPEVKHAVQPILQDFKKQELAKLPELLGEGAGSVRLGTAARGLITQLRRGGSAWRLLDGASLYHGTITDGETTMGNWSGTLSFDDPRAREEIRRFGNPLLEGTGEALDELDARFANLVAGGDSTAKLAVEEVRWYEAANSQPDPAQRLVLQVRAFERALPIWALDEFSNELFHLAHVTNRILIQTGVDRPARMEEWLVPEGHGRFSISLGTFLRQAKEIASLMPAGSQERRRVKAVGRWEAHPTRARQRIAEWEQRFSHLLVRALRQRNATVHGTQTVPEVVATVDGFISRVAAIVVAQTVESTTGGTTLMNALEKGRMESERSLWRLDQGESASSEVLFSPEGL